MRLGERSLFTRVPEESLQAAVETWAWLLGEELRARWLSLSGDVFLSSPQGEVFWLDTGEGRVEKIAATEDEFEKRLGDAASRDEWLLESVVLDLMRQGQEPSAGQCFGFSRLPVLGGAYDGENRVLVPALEHVGVTGALHEQLKDLPSGASVRLEVVD